VDNLTDRRRAAIATCQRVAKIVVAILEGILQARLLWLGVAALILIAGYLTLTRSWATSLDTLSLHWDPIVLLFRWILLGAFVGFFVHTFLYAGNKLIFGSRKQSERPHEIEGHFLGVVGVIYAVLVAFVVVTAWQARDDAAAITLQEQHAIDEVFHMYEGYAGVSTPLRAMLRDYSNYTAAEWVQMRYNQELCADTVESDVSCLRPVGAVSKHANALAYCIRRTAIMLDPHTPREQIIYRDSLTLIQSISELRDERRLRYQNRTLQPVLWWSFIIGALIIAVMKYMIAGQEWSKQMVRSMSLFSMVGMMIALALIFDRPFQGEMQVDGSGWSQLTREFDKELGPNVAPYRGLPNRCAEVLNRV
jgi:hypothetical protein